jgi:hypothetical protein
MTRLSRFVALLLVAASVSFGQTALATITGTITDATGAVIANVPVTVLNLENGGTFRGVSSDTGNYTVSQLPIGDYDLTITSPGFKSYTHSKFHLAAAQIMREDVSLEVGQTSESVTVTAEASLLKTESTEVSQNVTLAQLNNLPILVVGASNSGFRDPFASTRLVPGVSYSNSAATGGNAVSTMVVNGTPGNTYQTRLDGMTMNPTSPRLLGATMQTQPSVDALEEVAIQTSNFAAEFGAAGGAMINMVTKSGTNSYHGGAYDYGNNEALSAHAPYTGLRAKVRQTDYGVTLGGPLWIPKVYNGKNKTFFFFSYEQFRQANTFNTPATVPTQAYRNGDFSNLLNVENRLVTTTAGPATDPLGNQIRSGTIFDPASQAIAANGTAYRSPFVGNQIPVSRYDPVAAKILALVPNPQGTNASRGLLTDNYINPTDSTRHSNIRSIKLDQNMGSKGRLSLYLQETNTNVNRSPTGLSPLPDLLSSGFSSFSSGTTARLNYDYTATPRLLLHAGIGWNDSDFKLNALVEDYNAATALGLKGALLNKYFPIIITSASTNNAIGGMSQLGTGGPTASYERRPSTTLSGTYVTGSHTIKMGFDYRQEKFPQVIDAFSQGQYSFNSPVGATTGGISPATEQPSLIGSTVNNGFVGFALSSFLVGGLTNVQMNAPIDLAVTKSQTGVYVQDTWKVTRKLTLDYGLRWDFGTYAREQYGRNSSIGLRIANSSAAGRLGGSQFEQTCNCKFASNYPYGIGPRLGAAYQINSKTVLRAGFGVVYNATTTASGGQSNTASTSAVPANSGQTVGQLANGIPSSVQPVWPSFDSGVGHPVGGVIGMPTLLDANAGRPARLLQWSIALQREINRNLVVDASYVGNRGTSWTASGLAPLNSISQATLATYGFTNFTSAEESAMLTSTIASLTPARRSVLASRGVVLPYGNFPTNQTVRQSLRDYPQYNSNGLAGAPLGNTWYDSFQLNITQRFSHGLSANINYNYSKNLDLLSSPDVFNRSLGRNISANDIPHQLRFTIQYVVPQLRNTGIGMFQNHIVSYILSDWGVGTYLNYQSAPIVARPSSNGSLPINNFLGRGPGSAQLKKNADGSYMNPWSVNWVDNDGQQRTDPIDINCHCFDPTKNQVLNPAAWENIPDGQFGAQQSTLRFYRGIRLPNESANFSRNFRLAKEGRVNLNVRVEFTNIFNRMLLTAGPASTLVTAGNFAAAPTKFASGANTGLYSGGFGTFNVVGGLTGQRAGSFVARLSF